VARKREARRGDERLADECTATSFAGAGDG